MTTRALVVGLGSIGQRHARNLRALLGDALVLSALRSRRAPRIVTDALDGADGDPERDCDGGVFTDLSSALATKPDVVVVCNPSRLHVEVALAAVEAGADVFVEKPVSDTLDGVGALVRAATARRAVVGVGCQLRFHPALRRLQEVLAAGLLGRLVAAHVEEGEYLPGWHPYEDYRTSYAARRDLGGGVVLTQVHELDYVHWLWGLPRSVFAVGGRVSDLEIDVEDTASMLLDCRVDGRPFPVHVHLDYLQRPPRRACRVVGTDGSVDIDLLAPALTRRDATGRVVEELAFPGFERAQLFVDEMRVFLGAVADRSAPPVGLAHALGTLQLALAARRSLESGTAEAVPATVDWCGPRQRVAQTADATAGRATSERRTVVAT
ncbi:MAG TPA: Gfo/Idh/MocA family oxidoreductase [Acidimicrobiales bacterium]|nr:Gfo/Idh/MocA family oxidoreductase [Acidimicrobiales bacterium]